MPPKTANTLRKLTLDQKHIHTQLFTKTYRASRTLREIVAYVEHGTPIPVYHYPSGDTLDICLSDAQRNTLNSIISADAAVRLRKTSSIGDWVPAHHATIAAYGEMEVNDKAISWDIYTLITLLDHHTLIIRWIKHKLDHVAELAAASQS